MWIAANSIECADCGAQSVLLFEDNTQVFVDFTAQHSPVYFSAS